MTFWVGRFNPGLAVDPHVDPRQPGRDRLSWNDSAVRAKPKGHQHASSGSWLGVSDLEDKPRKMGVEPTKKSVKPEQVAVHPRKVVLQTRRGMKWAFGM